MRPRTRQAGRRPASPWPGVPRPGGLLLCNGFPWPAFTFRCFLGAESRYSSAGSSAQGPAKAASKVWARLHSFLKLRVIFQALGAVGRILFFPVVALTSSFLADWPSPAPGGRLLTQHGSFSSSRSAGEPSPRSCLPRDLREPWDRYPSPP